jgi:phosphate transport system substrate-binding protein
LIRFSLQTCLRQQRHDQIRWIDALILALKNQVISWCPNVKIDVEQGSGTAASALLDGVSQLGPMSRPMRSEEYEPFEKKYGYHPASFPVAVDALAIYVNKENPIECLTIEQLDQIFSKTHLYSRGENVTTWGDVGLNGDWETRPISLF